MIKIPGFFCAEELIKQCKKFKKNVLRATVYRCLLELLESGILRKTAFGDKHQHFEISKDKNLKHYARCIYCHKMIPMPKLHNEQIYEEKLANNGFKTLGHEIHFYGICHECQN